MPISGQIGHGIATGAGHWVVAGLIEEAKDKFGDHRELIDAVDELAQDGNVGWFRLALESFRNEYLVVEVLEPDDVRLWVPVAPSLIANQSVRLLVGRFLAVGSSVRQRSFESIGQIGEVDIAADGHSRKGRVDDDCLDAKRLDSILH